MKRLIHFICVVLLTSLIGLPGNSHSASGQSGKEKAAAIPDSINKIFQASCMPCHGSKGGRLPTSSLNFSKWAGYGAAKEGEKALSICSAVSNGTMPPRRMKDSNPELIPTKEQTDLICKWAESLKSENNETIINNGKNR